MQCLVCGYGEYALGLGSVMAFYSICFFNWMSDLIFTVNNSQVISVLIQLHHAFDLIQLIFQFFLTWDAPNPQICRYPFVMYICPFKFELEMDVSELRW